MAKSDKNGKKKEVIDNFQVVPEEARSVYKVFIQDEGDDDMHVDISNDSFSPDPASAIYAFLHSCTLGKLFSFPIFTLFAMSDEGEPKEVENQTTPKKPRERIVMIRLTANDADEFKAAVLGGDIERDPEVAFSVKALTQGYRTNIAEYRLNMIESFTAKDGGRNRIMAFKAERVSEDTTEFPFAIEGKSKKDGMHYHMGYDSEFTESHGVSHGAKKMSPEAYETFKKEFDGYPENTTLLEMVDESEVPGMSPKDDKPEG